jgi:hypothetical protein
LCRRFGDAWRAAQDEISLGAVSLAEGDVDTARRRLDDGIRTLRELGERSYVMLALDYAAGVAAAMGQHERAGRLAGAADALRAELGEPRPPADAAALDRLLAPALAALGEAGLAAAVSAGERMSPEEALDYVLTWAP